MSEQKKDLATKQTKAIADDVEFALGKENYYLLIVGFVIIIIGFMLMVGGGSDDPNVFSKEIFSTRRITIAPVVVLFGFVFEIWAIMKKPKEANNTDAI